MADRVAEEVDRNYAAFVQALPSLLATHRGKFALMREGEIITFFDTAQDAQVAGQRLFTDGLFSIQEVSDSVVDLGFFSHAVPDRPL